MNKQIIIDYEEYLKLIEENKGIKEALDKMKDALSKDYETFAPYCTRTILKIDENKIKEIFSADVVILEKSDDNE